jgi:hypothetical protein
MSILKTALAAASLALVTVTAANAQTSAPSQKPRTQSQEQRQSQPYLRGPQQMQSIPHTNEWDVYSPQPFSRDANDRFTW